MPEERVSTEKCHEYRKEIFSSIFPRWALILALGIIFGVISVVYYQSASATDAAKETAKRNELLETRFTMTVEHIKENQDEIKAEQKEQRILLQKIDRRLNGR